MRIRFLVCVLLGCAACARGQEASSGLDVRATLSGQVANSSVATESPRFGSAVEPGFRAVVYPTIKFSNHWSVTGALQSASRPYFGESFSTTGYGVKDSVLQASLNYSRVSDKGSLMVRAGQLSTAFGSFLLRYDDADNALVGMPLEYGYYYKAVSSKGVVGAQVDVSRGRWDARAQFANSSPANPRSIFAKDQYGNWAGGAGYTIRQGLRVGVSGYRGPYLSRDYPLFFPGEANPNTLPAHAWGVDAAWSHGHWDVRGEWQSFVMPYKLIPTFYVRAGYVEAKRVLTPRLYVAARAGYSNMSLPAKTQSFEGTAGFWVNRRQLLKAGYEVDPQRAGVDRLDKTFTVQLVTSVHLFSVAGK